MVSPRPKFSPTAVQAEACRMSLRRFAQEGWHTVDRAKLIWGPHLDALCDHLAYVSLGEIRFLVVNMPPRTSKSLVTSVIYPVWEWLQDPSLQFLTASYALQLSVRDALKSRRMIESEWFQRRWGHEWRFSFDEKLKRQYSNDCGGRRVAISVDSATTGEGGNRLVVDDPHNATDVESEVDRKAKHDWWDHAMSSRLNQPDKDAWIVNGQRTGEDDLFGHIERTHDMKEIVRLVLPNEYDPKRHCKTFLPYTGKKIFSDWREKAGELLVPQRLTKAATVRLKRTMKDKYTLQYNQNPKGVEGAILKRSSWQPWAGDAPECKYLFTVYDTAFEEGEENDFSARTDWGIFEYRPWIEHEDPDTGDVVRIRGKPRNAMILLGRWKDKIAYHKLKAEAKTHYRRHKHDWTLVEKKATGIVLCQDLSRARVAGLRKISLAHGKYKIDKVERANLASVVLDEGLVFYPEGRAWADEVIDECAKFPNATNDDITDTVVMALQFVRRMNEVGVWEDEAPDGEVRLFKRKRALYG